MAIVTRVPALGAKIILLAAIVAGSIMTAVANAATNLPPTISGTPPTTATVGTLYSFTPTAKDPEGVGLRFGIRNQPAWATFDRGTGRLSGTPKATGTFSEIQIYAWDGVRAGALPRFSITVSAAGTTNRAPTISGSPATSVTVGSSYSFRPTASDPDGNTLGFSITNRPSWAAFNTSTGQLSGTPTSSNVGTYSNIIIKVSDGKVSTALPAFAITVKLATSSTNRATLSWTAPTTNTDGSQLTNLSGYRIYYGTSSTVLSQTIQVSNASVSTYVVENLSPGTYYFAVKAVTSTGAESAQSNIASKAIQ